MFEFCGNFGGESGAGPVELEVESAVFSEAVKVQFFVKQSALKRNLELFYLQHF